MTILYHYTCNHWAPHIEGEGLVKPSAVAGWPGHRFSWWTDLEVPYREALGLTGLALSCDRTANRFRALTDDQLTKWTDARRGLPATLVAWLHSPPGVMPAHWWISTAPVPVEPANILEHTR